MNTVQTLESVPQLFRLGDVFFLQSKKVDIHDDNNNDDVDGFPNDSNLIDHILQLLVGHSLSNPS